MVEPAERAAKYALLIVDMQNGFLDANGSMARMGMDAARLRVAIAGCQRLVAAARDHGIPVIFTRYAYRAGYADGGLITSELLPAMQEVAHSSRAPGTSMSSTNLPASNDIIIDKARPSAFYGTSLEPTLTALKVTDLVVAGVTTNICVETTVRDAGQRDYRTTVARDATAEYDDQRHAVALETMGFMFGWVRAVDEIIESWASV